MFYELVNACAESHQWPQLPEMSDMRANQQLLHQTSSYLQEQQERLFIGNTARVLLRFWEGYAGKSHCETCEIRSLDGLKQHFDQHVVNKEKDPLVRHVFLSAGNSRKPLNCTLEAFQYLCTYHTVTPEFLDLLSTFGETNGKHVNFHQPKWYHEYWKPISKASGVPELGRSGWEIRNCYRLSAMEKSAYDGKWTMRQMAVFHSFDLSHGRSFMITVKANHDDIRRQIISLGRGAVPTTVAEAFARSLEIQLLDFYWCIGGWKQHLDILESQVRETQVRSTAIHFPSGTGTDEMELFTPVTEVSGQNLTNSSPPVSMGPRYSLTERVVSFLRRDTRKSTNNTGSLHTADAELEAEKMHMRRQKNNEMRIIQVAERIRALEDFPFAGLQKLTSAKVKLREAQLVMSLNNQVLQGIRDKYRELANADELPQAIRSDPSMPLKKFEDQLRNLERMLSTECARVDALLHIASDGNNLYDSIVQLKSSEVSQLFAMDAFGASMRMEKSTKRMESMTQSMHEIAKNTEKDTSSMHVVTILTLIFLPGTFLGTFFSTPIFEGEAPENRGWAFNQSLFLLFLEICAPMMLITIGLWRIYMKWAKSRSDLREKSQSASMC